MQWFSAEMRQESQMSLFPAPPSRLVPENSRKIAASPSASLRCQLTNSTFSDESRRATGLSPTTLTRGPSTTRTLHFSPARRHTFPPPFTRFLEISQNPYSCIGGYMRLRDDRIYVESTLDKLFNKTPEGFAVLFSFGFQRL